MVKKIEVGSHRKESAGISSEWEFATCSIEFYRMVDFSTSRASKWPILLTLAKIQALVMGASLRCRWISK